MQGENRIIEILSDILIENQGMRTGLFNLRDEVISLKGEMINLKEEVTHVKEEISLVKEEVTQVKEEITLVKEEVTQVKEEITLMKEEFNSRFDRNEAIQVNQSLAIGELRLSVMKLTNAIENFPAYEERLKKLESVVFRQAG